MAVLDDVILVHRIRFGNEKRLVNEAGETRDRGGLDRLVHYERVSPTVFQQTSGDLRCWSSNSSLVTGVIGLPRSC